MSHFDPFTFSFFRVSFCPVQAWSCPCLNLLQANLVLLLPVSFELVLVEFYNQIISKSIHGNKQLKSQNFKLITRPIKKVFLKNKLMKSIAFFDVLAKYLNSIYSLSSRATFQNKICFREKSFISIFSPILSKVIFYLEPFSKMLNQKKVFFCQRHVTRKIQNVNVKKFGATFQKSFFCRLQFFHLNTIDDFRAGAEPVVQWLWEKTCDHETDREFESWLGIKEGHFTIFLMLLFQEAENVKEKEVHQSNQCDQIGRFFALWATILSRWQQLCNPNCPHC